MITPDVLFDRLAIAGFATGILVALLAGRFRGESSVNIALTGFGSGLSLAALAWAIHYGDGALFAALAVGLGATLWSLGNERGKREARTIR